MNADNIKQLANLAIEYSEMYDNFELGFCGCGSTVTGPAVHLLARNFHETFPKFISEPFELRKEKHYAFEPVTGVKFFCLVDIKEEN